MKISPLFLDLIQHQQCSTSLAESQSWPRKEKLDYLWGGRLASSYGRGCLMQGGRHLYWLHRKRAEAYDDVHTGHGTCDTTVDPSHLHPQREPLFKHGEALGPGIESSRAVECLLESTTLAFLSFLFRPKTASKSPAVSDDDETSSRPVINQSTNPLLPESPDSKVQAPLPSSPVVFVPPPLRLC